MTVEKFIRKYHREIDRVIRRSGYREPIDNDEREGWIMNDEGLYNLYISEGGK